MKFKRNENLSMTARKRLIKGLMQVATLYFNDKHAPHGGVPDTVNICCGICKALNDIGYEHSYMDMMNLMSEMNDNYYAGYAYEPKQWEPRAFMCLFLVEYLKDTIPVTKVTA